MLAYLLPYSRLACRLPTVRSQIICCRRIHKSADIPFSRGYKRQIARLERMRDGVSPQEKLIYRSSLTLFLTSTKWLILAIPVYMYYVAGKSIYKYYMVEETVHPSQLDPSTEVTPLMAACGMALSSLAAFSLLVLSRVLVRRIYYNDTTQQFRLVVSNLIGNRKYLVGHKAVTTKDNMFINHKLGSLNLQMVDSSFTNITYYHLLVLDS